MTWLLANILLAAIRININWREEPVHARCEGFEVWDLVKLVKFICQAVYTSNFTYDNFLYDKYACTKAGIPVFEQVHFSYENCHMAPSTRAYKTCHRKLLVELRLNIETFETVENNIFFIFLN